MAEVMSTVQFTDKAIAEFKAIIKEENRQPDQPLRVGVKGGGCAGLSYILDFDEKKEFDEEFDFQGLKVVVDQRQMIYLMGIEIDYEYGLNDRGFIFRNPNANNTCGCGTSFSA